MAPDPGLAWTMVPPDGREMRMGNVLALILAPEDRELMERSEGTVMLVMF